MNNSAINKIMLKCELSTMLRVRAAKYAYSTHANCFRHLNIAGDNYSIGPPTEADANPKLIPPAHIVFVSQCILQDQF